MGKQQNVAYRYHCAMWENKEVSMQRHILMHMAATYFNIGDVEKMAFTTWSRALK
jgi:hypothetical protein